MNKSAVEYYNEIGIDITKLPYLDQNVIASMFLENNPYTKEEVEKIFKERNIEL